MTPFTQVSWAVMDSSKSAKLRFSTTKIVIDRCGEVELTEPDENGMQWKQA
jgi:hypothetical protein